MLQLATVGSLTRSVRIGTILLSVAVGLYGCGTLAVALELAYTRGMAYATGTQLYEVVTTASYTVNPFIEEFVKVAPLLIAALSYRVRLQWGLTDYVLLGAGCGAGFALAEALFRFGQDADKAIANPTGGWFVPVTLGLPHVRSLSQTVASWLPGPVDEQGLLGLSSNTAGINVHLVLSALAGLGVGLLLRPRWWLRPIGAAALILAGIDHAAYNHSVASVMSPSRDAFGDFLALVTPTLDVAHRLLWLYPLLCLALATIVDWPVIRRGRASLPQVQLADERHGQPSAIALARYASVGLPWTPLVALRFMLLRRSLTYAHARATPQRLAPLLALVIQVRAQMDQSNSATT